MPHIRRDDAPSYSENGYAVFRGLIPEQLIQPLRDDVAGLLENPAMRDPANLRCRFKLDPRTGVNILDAVDPVIDVLTGAAEIAAFPPLLEALAGIYGEPARLLKDKLILKTPGTPGYPWHQDFIAWPFFPESFVTAMVGLDASDEHNGCLRIVRGSHRRGYLSPRDGDFHDLGPDSFDPAEVVNVPLRPGDVVVFGAFTIHGSDANQSDGPRRHLYLSYNADSDGGEQRAAHYRYFHAWLRRRYQEYGTKDCYFR
jgi:hypothetical protein